VVGYVQLRNIGIVGYVGVFLVSSLPPHYSPKCRRRGIPESCSPE
jgi:hypothetical protein